MIVCLWLSQAGLSSPEQPKVQPILPHLGHLLTGFTPAVELEQAGASLLGYLDLGRLVVADAVEVAKQMGRTVREQLLSQPALGLARGKFPAHLAAQCTRPNHLRLIRPGCEAAFLVPFSINHLPIEPALKRQLHLLGLHTIGQVAALPARALLNQFGAPGRQLHHLAQGYDDRPVSPCHTPQVEQALHQFDAPVVSRTILAASLQLMAANLATSLQADGRAGREVGLTLHLEDGTGWTKQVILSRPTHNPDRFTHSLTALLDQSQLHCGVVEVAVSLADLVPARGHQLDLFVHQTEQGERLQACLPDLAARYGATTFYRPRLADQQTYLPERRFQLQEVE